MKQNTDLMIELNVHGHNRYEEVVLQRIAKYERMCQEEAEAGARQEERKEEEEDLLADVPDEDMDKQFV